MRKNTTKQQSKQREHGQGTIWQEAPGKWRGQIAVGIGADGKTRRRSVSGSSRENVQKRLDEIRLLMDSAECSAVESGITLAQVAHQWLHDFKRIEICSKTYEWYANLIDHMIVPQLGGVALYRINAMQIQSLLNRLILVDGYAVRTVRGVQSCLKQIFEFAVQMGMVQGDPAANVKLPKQRRKPRNEEKQAIPIQVRTQILTAVETEPLMRVALTVLLFTGLRIGELLALRWSDIYFEGRTITVDEAVVRRPVYSEQGELVRVRSEVAEPKTYSSYRVIRVPEQVVEVLAEWKTSLEEQPWGKCHTKPASFVLTSSKTQTAYTYTGFRTVYYKFLERHDLKRYDLNLHRYRHTFATMLLENGTSPKVVQMLMGHTNITTTLNVYTHAVPELFDAVADALGDVYQDTLNGSYQIAKKRA